ncbi:MAG TPA: hypothetical protein VGO53_16585 [Steroidobacteraceae bacterium]|nr:hypothetical protein [Steroidobacteraceae bacterium]
MNELASALACQGLRLFALAVAARHPRPDHKLSTSTGTVRVTYVQTFTCDACREEFMMGWTDEEAIAEAKAAGLLPPPGEPVSFVVRRVLREAACGRRVPGLTFHSTCAWLNT